MGGDEAVSEDCLYLNIWSAASSTRNRRPVLVWFYGGGYTSGSGSARGFDGEGLARKGVVVVTMNYRLGILGFLTTPELSSESSHHVSGNYALLDKIACLQWVKRNIAAFGGDPSRVTIAGQSSGAESVDLLLISPLAKGLFQRALSESGARSPHDPAFRGHPVYWASRQEAENAGSRFMAAQGLHSLRELRAIPWNHLNTHDIPLEEYRAFFDGWVFPQGFEATYARGLQNDVPLMMGFNRDELLGPPERLPAPTLDSYQSTARARMGEYAEGFLQLYPAASDQQAVQAHLDATRDAHRLSLFLLASEWRRKAKSPIYTYFWTHAPPEPDRDARGVYHGSEISYFLNNLYARNLPWTDDDRRIADVMSSYLVTFVSTGNPNAPNLPVWPAFQPYSRTTMELGDHFQPIAVTDDAKFELLQRYFLQQQPQ
jgi:carboxylesterase type B